MTGLTKPTQGGGAGCKTHKTTAPKERNLETYNRVNVTLGVAIAFQCNFTYSYIANVTEIDRTTEDFMQWMNMDQKFSSIVYRFRGTQHIYKCENVLQGCIYEWLEFLSLNV